MGNWFAAAAAGVLALIGSSTADHKPPRFDDHSARIGSTTLSQNVTCISNAVAFRESALDAAMTTHTQEINAAYSARASALAAAYSKSGNDAIRTAVKDAWKQFTASIKVSRKSWQTSKETAWKSFKSAMQACGGGAAGASDSANAGQEMNE